jgi:cytochrome P450
MHQEDMNRPRRGGVTGHDIGQGQVGQQAEARHQQGARALPADQLAQRVQLQAVEQRTALADVTVAGQQFRKGDWVMLAYQSANRDEAVFPDPFSFDIDRPRVTSLTFGTGPHVCLGQHLARMEMRVLWEELLPLLAEVRLNGTPRRTISNFVCGPKDVPIAYRFAEA